METFPSSFEMSSKLAKINGIQENDCETLMTNTIQMTILTIVV